MKPTRELQGPADRLGVIQTRPDAETPRALYLSESVIEVGGRPNLLSRLSAEDYMAVRERGREIVIECGDHAFQQGEKHDGIFVIEAGSIRTYYTGPSGREITLAYWTPGHFVGGPEVFGGGEHMWSGVAIRRSRLLHLKGAEIERLMTRLPSLAIGIVEGLVFKGKCYSALVHMLGTRSVVERLAQLLLTLAELDGAACDAGLRIARQVTHEELATMVGATRQWVTKTMENFQKEGLIAVADRHITLCDLSGLREIVDGA
jgi:CRP-like cAMP-binding protein